MSSDSIHDTVLCAERRGRTPARSIDAATVKEPAYGCCCRLANSIYRHNSPHYISGEQFCSPRTRSRAKSGSLAETHTGRCYRGAVEIEMRGDPLEMGYCHCENCRRYSAAPVSAFTLWKPENVKITKGAEFLGKFKSREISDRR
jgi:glutathione-dependent formaldehyde-activating enzyme